MSILQGTVYLDIQIRKIDEDYEARIRKIEEEYRRAVESHRQSTAEKELILAELNKKCSSLGFFKRREKNKLQARIREVEADIKAHVTRQPDFIVYQRKIDEAKQGKQREIALFMANE